MLGPADAASYLPPCSGPDALAPVAGAFFGAALPAAPDADPAYRVRLILCRAQQFDTGATCSTAVLGGPKCAITDPESDA